MVETGTPPTPPARPTPPVPPGPRSGPRSAVARRRAGRTTRRWSAAAHRWLALVIGTVLAVELVTGTIVLFRPEIYALAQPHLFAATPSARPLDAQAAMDVVHRSHPAFQLGDTTWVDGVWQVADTDYDRTVYVDPGTGRVLGESSLKGGFIGLMLNVHDCLLSCEGYPGYVPAMAATVPGLGKLSWAELVLGVVGLGFAVLAVSGLVAWWPAMTRFLRNLRTSLTVHLRRGQYRTHRDLHDVLAVVAVPFLLMWAITGAGYYLTFVGDTWYSLTGGGKQPTVTMTVDAVPPGTPDIGPDAAVAAAVRVVPNQELVSVTPPSEALGQSYAVGLQSGIAPARYAGARVFAETLVAVDPHTGRAQVTSGGPEQRTNDWLWTNGNYGAHFGFMVPWWARLVWLAAGLVSIYLVGSGFGTWWWRARLRRRRRLSAAEPQE